MPIFNEISLVAESQVEQKDIVGGIQRGTSRETLIRLGSSAKCKTKSEKNQIQDPFMCHGGSCERTEEQRDEKNVETKLICVKLNFDFFFSPARPFVVGGEKTARAVCTFRARRENENEEEGKQARALGAGEIKAFAETNAHLNRMREGGSARQCRMSRAKEQWNCVWLAPQGHFKTCYTS
jgi:hypothetical protein